MTSKVIGLSGFAQSGKDTVAGILVRDHGYTRVAFADPIKDLLYEINPPLGRLRLDEFIDEYGWDTAKQRPDVRAMLQNLGVGARRVLGDNVWVRAAMMKLNDLNGKYVITDVRFENETTMIRQLNGVIWRIDRPNVVAANDHVSEHQLNDYEFDQWIYNLAGLDYLERTVENLMRHAE